MRTRSALRHRWSFKSTSFIAKRAVMQKDAMQKTEAVPHPETYIRKIYGIYPKM
jgi:hypothetical protein